MKRTDKKKIYAAVFVVAVLVLVLATVMKKHESRKTETQEGLEKLAQMESLKVEDVEKEIQEKVDKRRQLAEEKAQTELLSKP